jgi:hypothetical protein
MLPVDFLPVLPYPQDWWLPKLPTSTASLDTPTLQVASTTGYSPHEELKNVLCQLVAACAGIVSIAQVVKKQAAPSMLL